MHDFQLKETHTMWDNAMIKEYDMRNLLLSLLLEIDFAGLMNSQHKYKGSGVPRKEKTSLWKYALSNRCNCFINPYIMYCIELWGAAS